MLVKWQTLNVSEPPKWLVGAAPGTFLIDGKLNTKPKPAPKPADKETING
jgi:hypothetical protein